MRVSGVPIRVDGLTKSFGGVTGVALAPTTLTIGAGEFIVLIGASGCGKTTLLRCIAGLTDVTAGTLSIGELSAAQARAQRRIGFAPQDPSLLPWRTVLDNVTLLTTVNAAALPADRPDPRELLAEVGLADYERARPHELSGGMRQRVALARVFATGAPLLLMDEPFAALDEITRADMRSLLLRLWVQRRRTVVFTTHALEEAVLLADRVLVMGGRPGRVVADLAIGLDRPSGEEIVESAAYLDALGRVRSALRSARGSS